MEGSQLSAKASRRLIGGQMMKDGAIFGWRAPRTAYEERLPAPAPGLLFSGIFAFFHKVTHKRLMNAVKINEDCVRENLVHPILIWKSISDV
ncbi:hypothetical protein KIN20_024311 [Parelaphostrongylus tenuis]|uniref:Uncharacterized protein n=1 Tax=Parelaphostrongylus tenuis TaxID=148309 RepID=A0AAD5MT85_PARTN|nr:hypothetical protein KIN20_024311 [Parelaphostrongylus tenuis]